MTCGPTLEGSIMEVVREIRMYESRRAELARRIAGDARVSELMRKVDDFRSAGISVCGVDGGLLQLSLSTLDVFAARAVAVIFRYSGRVLTSVSYFPSEYVPPRFFIVREPLDSVKAGVLAGMRRQMLEASCAAGVAGRGMADLILLDGSVVPQYTERLSDNREFSAQYGELMNAYAGLYSGVTDGGILLAGFVKDSRGKRFCEILTEKVDLDEEERRFLAGSRDVAILDSVLPAGWRTIAFPYAEESPAPLSDLGSWARGVHIFYMRASEFDRPFRVEFLSTRGSPEETADRISSVLGFLLSFGLGASIPPVLLEADLRARLREEASWIQDRILDGVGPRFLTRRERRPL